MPPPAAPIVLDQVVKNPGGRRVLDGLTLSVPAGQITALMGPSGAGKTVTVKHIVGLLIPDAGDVLLDGRPVPEMSDAELRAARQRCGVLLQGSTLSECGLFGNVSIHENVAFAAREAGCRRPEADALATQWLDKVGLGEHANKHPFELSAGMRKRAGLARALATDAPVLILDDLESGLDGVRLNLVCQLVLRVHRERRGTVLLTTHKPDVARRVADVVAVLNSGAIVANGPASELLPAASDAAPVAASFAAQFLSAAPEAVRDLDRHTLVPADVPRLTERQLAIVGWALLALIGVLLLATVVFLLLP